MENGENGGIRYDDGLAIHALCVFGDELASETRALSCSIVETWGEHRKLPAAVISVNSGGCGFGECHELDSGQYARLNMQIISVPHRIPPFVGSPVIRRYYVQLRQP